MTEQAIQKKIINYLEKNGAYVVKVISASKIGVPDLLVCINGTFVGIEVKKPTTLNTVSSLQRYNLKKIRECGGISFVASSIDDVKDLICLIE